MSRKGDCWDNAVAESFFGTPRAELVDCEHHDTHAEATTSIGDYIDNFYNIERRHSHLGYVNPIGLRRGGGVSVGAGPECGQGR